MKKLRSMLSCVWGVALLCVFIATSSESLGDVSKDGDTCETAYIIGPGSSGELQDDFADYANDYNAPCGYGRFGPDLVFWVDQAPGDTLEFTFENLGDNAIGFMWWITFDCSQICVTGLHGVGDPGTPETWTIIASTPYYLGFDANEGFLSFPFRLTWSARQDTSPVEQRTWGHIKTIYQD